MGDVVRIWGSRKPDLKPGYFSRKQWLNVTDQLLITGNEAKQVGKLSFVKVDNDKITLRLIVAKETVYKDYPPGNNIPVYIKGREILIGVRAIDGGKIFVEFIAPSGFGIKIFVRENAPSLGTSEPKVV